MITILTLGILLALAFLFAVALRPHLARRRKASRLMSAEALAASFMAGRRGFAPGLAMELSPRQQRIAELTTRCEALRTELDALDAREVPADDADEAVRSAFETGTTRMDAALTEFDEANTERASLVAREAALAAVRGVTLDMPEPGAPRARTGSLSDRERTRAAAFENLDAIRTGQVGAADLRARALDAIETAPEHMTDAERERATELVQVRTAHSANIARHVLMTGSDDYHAAFEEYMRSGYAGEALRASMSLTDANGGYLVPFTLDPTIILTNDGTANPFRQLARVVSITTDTWNGVTSAGVSAEWTAEGAEAADASPVFAQPSIKAERADAYIEGTYEVLADSGFASQIGMLLADAKDRLEGNAFAIGNGVNKPEGVITGLVAAGKIITSATADTYAAADVYALQGAVPVRHRSRATWVGANAIANRTRQFDTSGGSAFWANFGASTPEQLLGRPFVEASDMDGVINAAQENYVLANVDLSQYVIVDRVGMSVLYDPLVKGPNQRPTGKAGWFAFWRVGGKLVNPNAGRVLNVT